MSLKELTAILTLQTKYATPALTPEQVKVLYKVTDPAGSNSAPCELIAATWSHEPLDRALLMRNTFRTCDFDQSGEPRLASTNAHAHARACLCPCTCSRGYVSGVRLRPASPGTVTRRSVLWLYLLGRYLLTPGTIDKKEFSNLSENQDQASLAIQLAVFDLVDTSGDGLIQQDEFVAFNIDSGEKLSDMDFATQTALWIQLAKKRSSVDRDALLRKTFATCDTDHSGELLLAEFKAMAASSTDKVAAALQMAVFEMADTSGDGILEVNEFVLYNLEQGKGLIDFDFAQQCRVWTDLANKATASRPASARSGRPGSARSRPTSAKRT